MWQILRIVKKGDYLYAVVPDHPKRTKNNYVLMHRVVMENHIVRLLTDDEEIHHVDRDKKNNDVSNLQVLTKAEHRELHVAEKRGRTQVEFVCPICGTKFYKESRQTHGNRKHGPFCSRSCNGKNSRRVQMSKENHED